MRTEPAQACELSGGQQGKQQQGGGPPPEPPLCGLIGVCVGPLLCRAFCTASCRRLKLSSCTAPSVRRGGREQEDQYGGVGLTGGGGGERVAGGAFKGESA
jgi:hypothetical protein